MHRLHARPGFGGAQPPRPERARFSHVACIPCAFRHVRLVRPPVANSLCAEENRLDGARETLDQISWTAQMQRADDHQRPLRPLEHCRHTRRPRVIARIENRVANAGQVEHR